MPERVNRKDLIVKVATQLFAEQGYRATSTRQIAAEVGCTEAALYYHFKGGKYALLQAVMEARMPTVHSVMEECAQATSLETALRLFAANFAKHTPEMRWLMRELPDLNDAERDLVIGNFSTMHRELRNIVAQFVIDEARAKNIAWLVICIGAGYQQVFTEAAFQGQVETSMQELMETFIDLIV